MDTTSLGDRMKWYEKRYAHEMMPMVPVLARVDGRAFHSFTKGLERPYDDRLSRLMIETTKFLVEETNARCGYTQSDEISLVWLTEDPDSEIFFGGKLSKMCSVVGSLATYFFNKLLPDYIPSHADKMALFDNRVWEVPVLYEACNYFIWRENDATRNSLQMAARAYYSHEELHGKDTSALHELLFQKGVKWAEYPRFFKRGTYVRRRDVERAFTTEELSALPPKHHAHQNPNLTIKRTAVVEEDFVPMSRIHNREEVIFEGKKPLVVITSDLCKGVPEAL